MILDDINQQIVKHLSDGRKSFSEIADKLSITTNTVRARVSRLIRRGVLAITGLVNPDKIEDHFVVIVGINLKTMNLVQKGKEFSKLKGVVSVAVVTGRFDLIVVAFLNNKFGLSEFYTQEVSKIADVQSAETFVVYKNYNWGVPYQL
ncbi:MAG: Lrp/AsnC family transcriptional regulator [Desulfarculaceae bacterium]|jgi:Lrp/AsnC family transcriptional regulator for asnA, asnC and gidA